MPCIGARGPGDGTDPDTEPRGLVFSDYATLIVGKAAVFVLLLLLAAWNRWRAVPALERASQHTDVAACGAALRRSIGIEYLLMSAVLSATAVLTTFDSP